MIPDWLARENPPDPLDSGACKVRGRGGKGFVGRTIESVARFLRDGVLTDGISGSNGLLQSLDPRIKIVTIIALIVTVSVIRSPVAIWGMYCFTLLLAAASSVPLLLFIKRVWLFIPLFAIVIVVPALFNVVTPGEPLLTVAHFARGYTFGPYRIPETITVTLQGALTALTFTGRVVTSVSLGALLTLTTQWSELLRALNVIGIPHIFVLILAMAYRYILLLARAVQNIHIARKSRTLHYGSTGSEQSWVASRIGYLFKMAWNMSMDVHQAMIARGFSGEIRSLALFRSGSRDYAWSLFVVLTCVLVLYVDHMTHYW